MFFHRYLLFSPDEKLLAFATSEHTIEVMRVSDGTVLYTLKGHTDKILSMAFSADSQYLASASGLSTMFWPNRTGDRSIRLWRMSDGTLAKKWYGPNYEIHGLAFSPDGRWLVTGSADRMVRWWEMPMSK